MKEILEKQVEDQNRETIVESENKEVDEDVEAGFSGEKVEDAHDEVKADVVEREAMEVDEKVIEKTAWAGEQLKGSEASAMDSFRLEQEEISHAEGNEAIKEDRGLKQTAEKTQDGQSLLGGEILEVGSTMRPGDDTKVLDLEPVEVGTVLGPLLL